MQIRFCGNQIRLRSRPCAWAARRPLSRPCLALRARPPQAAAAGASPGQSPPENEAHKSEVPYQRSAIVPIRQPDGAEFEWRRQWFPLAPLSYLDTTRPSAHTVLGHNLAVWRSPVDGKWAAFEDRCPHRMAPLSEGRIDAASGSLQCSYHGWSFDATGACTRIPQADSPSQAQAARSTPRACAARYPVTEESGLLFVWMDPSPEGAAASATRRPALPDELVSGNGTLLGDWYVRELPLSYEFLVENLLDPSHVNWSHHGLIGSREKVKPLTLHAESGAGAGCGGFTFSISGNETPSLSHFLPPSLTWLQFGGGADPKMLASFVFYAVPVTAGRSRLIAGYSTDALPPVLLSALQSSLVTPLMHAFQWAGDLGNHEVVDGDTLLLHYQEEQARQQAGGGRRAAYFMPAGADAAVQAFRKWLDGPAGGEVEYGPAVGSPLPARTRREILNRYDQHTRFCPHCRKALSTVQAARAALSTATAASSTASLTLALLQAVLLPPPSLLWLRVPPRNSATLALASAAVGFAALNEALKKLEERFSFTDYVHADK